jgi:roadblock/LC7 domain-containing protein
MKKLIILILVVAAGYFAYQKFVVGESSEELKQVQALADEFTAARQQMAQAERAAGVSGMDLLVKLQKLKEGLTEEKALQKADELEIELKAFLERTS